MNWIMKEAYRLTCRQRDLAIQNQVPDRAKQFNRLASAIVLAFPEAFKDD